MADSKWLNALSGTAPPFTAVTAAGFAEPALWWPTGLPGRSCSTWRPRSAPTRQQPEFVGAAGAATGAHVNIVQVFRMPSETDGMVSRMMWYWFNCVYSVEICRCPKPS